MSKFLIEADRELSENAKKIVKEQGYLFQYYLTSVLERAFEETIEAQDVEKQIFKKGGKK